MHVTNMLLYSSVYSAWLVSYIVASLQPGLLCRQMPGNGQMMMCVEPEQGENEMVHMSSRPVELSLNMCAGDCDDDLDCAVSF